MTARVIRRLRRDTLRHEARRVASAARWESELLVEALLLHLAQNLQVARHPVVRLVRAGDRVRQRASLGRKCDQSGRCTSCPCTRASTRVLPYVHTYASRMLQPDGARKDDRKPAS